MHGPAQVFFSLCNRKTANTTRAARALGGENAQGPEDAASVRQDAARRVGQRGKHDAHLPSGERQRASAFVDPTDGLLMQALQARRSPTAADEEAEAAAARIATDATAPGSTAATGSAERSIADGLPPPPPRARGLVGAGA